MALLPCASAPHFQIRLGCVNEDTGSCSYALAETFYTLALANAIAYRKYQIYDSIEVVGISDFGKEALGARQEARWAANWGAVSGEDLPF